MEDTNDVAAEELAGDELWTVGDVAELVGVSVRTLHHWDAIGLATPGWRSPADYRLYDSDDIARIHNILLYRETGMPLKEIAEVLDSDTEPLQHLERQLALLREQSQRVSSKIQAVTTLITHAKENTMSEKDDLTPEEKADVLGTEWIHEWKDEAEDKWGGTQDWEISVQRQSNMSRADFEALKSRTEELEAKLADAFSRGVEPGSDEASQLAEEHRVDLSQWFPVSHSKHVLIARGYVTDPRFTAHYDQRAEGLAQWLKGIIDNNAAAHGVDPAAAEWE